jgi:hypothetical protein
MYTQGTFALVHLSEIAKLRKRIERKLSTAAHAAAQLTFMFHREKVASFLDFHCANEPIFDLDIKPRMFPGHLHMPRSPVLIASTEEALRMQDPEPLSGILEFVDFDVGESLNHLWKYSHSCSPSLGYAMDINFRAAVSIFRIWRGMFSADGIFSTFSAVAKIRNGLEFRITHRAVSDASIPELSMVVDVICTGDASRRHKFCCFFNYKRFFPEVFSMSMLKVFSEQLVQLVTAKLREVAEVGNSKFCDENLCHPNKRPALEI